VEVPTFDKYDFIQPLTSEQNKFFDYWRREWERGKTSELGLNVGYLYEYLRRGIKHKDQIIIEIPRLLLSYRHVDEVFTWLCQQWISDYYLLTGHYGLALDAYPPLRLGATATHPANNLLNVKPLAGSFVRGPFILRADTVSSCSLSARCFHRQKYRDMVYRDSAPALRRAVRGDGRRGLQKAR
jgi:hypothetical protein